MERKPIDPLHALFELLHAAKKVDAAIAAIHSVYGAPGDWGYGEREGKALFALYSAAAKLRSAIDDAETASSP